MTRTLTNVPHKKARFAQFLSLFLFSRPDYPNGSRNFKPSKFHRPLPNDRDTVSRLRLPARPLYPGCVQHNDQAEAFNTALPVPGTRALPAGGIRAKTERSTVWRFRCYRWPKPRATLVPPGKQPASLQFVKSVQNRLCLKGTWQTTWESNP